MNWSLTIGRIAGTRARVHFTLLIVFAWIFLRDYLNGGLAAAGQSIIKGTLLFACIALHEFGHVAAARWFGVNTPEVILWPFGGIAVLEKMPEKPSQDLIVALAGPLVTAALAILAAGAIRLLPGTANSQIVEWVLFANIWMVAVNILPMWPLDGGRVLAASLNMHFKPERAQLLASRIGTGLIFVLAVLIVALAIARNPLALLVFVLVFPAVRFASPQKVPVRVPAELSVGDAMEAAPHVLTEDQPISRAVGLSSISSRRVFPVTDSQGRGIGLVDRDTLMRRLEEGAGSSPVGEIMRDCMPLSPNEPLAEAFSRMRDRGISAELVADSTGRVVGVLTTESVHRQLTR